ncbi:DAK2 domain-containing protein [Streptomyces sp. Agncl-13]|uniref:DAK2 domain-containing protein n=1 Tax=Streptomyces sp. Agncl-13 TaxID=3400628 RepID=UPI003A89DEF5
MPQVPQTFFDALAVRTWCGLALRALGRAREEIDAINVYPVADGDTGTNLYLTMESAAAAVEAVFDGHGTLAEQKPPLADAARAMAHGALIGARGNSGTILAQLLRGMAQVLAADGETAHTDGEGLRLALRRAADSARHAVAHPVEGTVLSVASAAADAADDTGGDCGTVARTAYEGACAALAALVETFTGEVPVFTALEAHARVAADETHTRVEDVFASHASDASDASGAPEGTPCEGGPAFEVIYLLEADDSAVTRLRERLDALGDSLVVVGGDGLWNVHVHVDDAGAAVEAGVEAGRPYRIRITHFGLGDVHTTGAERPPRERAQRAVVAVVPGEGLAGLYGEAGATTVLARPGEPPASGELVAAVRRAHAREVVLLPNDAELRHTAAAAAEQARAEGIRVALIPTRSAVQGIAALAVHEPERRFDEDVVSMTSAAGATRYAEVAVAERQSWTMAGICQAGDVLGLVDGDVAVIGADVTATARAVLDRMLAAGGELVTLVLGDEAPVSVADILEIHVRESYLAVDTVVYRGGRQGALLLIGVE